MSHERYDDLCPDMKMFLHQRLKDTFLVFPFLRLSDVENKKKMYMEEAAEFLGLDGHRFPIALIDIIVDYLRPETIHYLGRGAIGSEDWCNTNCTRVDIFRVHALGDEWSWNENEGLTTGILTAAVACRPEMVHGTDNRIDLPSSWRSPGFCCCWEKKRKRTEYGRPTTTTTFDIYNITKVGYHQLNCLQ